MAYRLDRTQFTMKCLCRCVCLHGVLGAQYVCVRHSHLHLEEVEGLAGSTVCVVHMYALLCSLCVMC